MVTSNTSYSTPKYIQPINLKVFQCSTPAISNILLLLLLTGKNIVTCHFMQLKSTWQMLDQKVRALSLSCNAPI